MIYTIKPLEWGGDISEEYGRLNAKTPFGSYDIIKTEEPEDYDSPFHLHYCFVEYYDDGVFPADSVEHAKELAWQDWTKRLEGALILFNSVKDRETLAQLELFFSVSTFYTNDLNP
jgi:hypothetical protein